MKKVLAAVIFVILVSFSSCDFASDIEIQNTVEQTTESTEFTMPAHPMDDPNMDSELADEVRRAYIKTMVMDLLLNRADDVFIRKYVGDYNGGVVVWVTVEGKQVTHMEDSETIGDYTVHYGNSARPLYYRDGRFYSLSSAYDAELISRKDAYDIGCALNSDFKERYPVAPN